MDRRHFLQNVLAGSTVLGPVAPKEVKPANKSNLKAGQGMTKLETSATA